MGLVVLAAGNSSRLGEPKQLLRYQNRTLLAHAIQAGMDAGCSPLVVVLGYAAERMRPEIEKFPAEIAINEKWETGMGSSLRRGIESLEKDDLVEAALVTLCDQPKVDGMALKRLLTAWGERKEQMVAARYGETFGVPAVFPRKYFSALKQLPQSVGAKQLLRGDAGEVFGVELEGAAVDIDTRADLEQLG